MKCQWDEWKEDDMRGAKNVAKMGQVNSGLEPIPGSDWKGRECRNPNHNPPMHIHIPAGQQYRHICPGCGHEMVIRSHASTECVCASGVCAAGNYSG